MHARMLELRGSLEDEFELKGVVEEQFDGAACYGLRLVKKGDEQQRESTMYFGAGSGLPRGFRGAQPGPAGPMTAVITIGEWKKIDGVQFFHGMAFEGGGQKMTTKFTSIVLNTVDPDEVTLPDEVKKLAKKQGPDGVPMELEDFAPHVQMMIGQVLRDLPMDDPQALRMARSGMAAQVERMPGVEVKQGMQYVLRKIDERLEELESD